MAAQVGCWCVLALLLLLAPSEFAKNQHPAAFRAGTNTHEKKDPRDHNTSKTHEEKDPRNHKTSTTRPDSVMTDLSCYNAPKDVLQSLQRFPFPKRTVFFLETSCKGALNSRQACAVESTAAANAKWSIVVVFTGPLKRSFFRGKSFKTLSYYPNIQFRRLNVTEFTKGSPVHHLFVRGNITNSMYPVVHSSDILRILVLYRLGGIYLDLDIITMKSFDPLPKNFVAKQANGAHANAIIAISKDEIGIKFAEMLLRDLAKNYNPNSWDANGPHLIGRKLGAIKTCDSGHYTNKAAYICEGIQVFEPDSFYPIRWYDLRKYYEDNPIMKTEAYTHHMFNSKGKKLTVSPNTLCARLAAKYCPNIYKSDLQKFDLWHEKKDPRDHKTSKTYEEEDPRVHKTSKTHEEKDSRVHKTSTTRPDRVMTDLSCYNASKDVLQSLQRSPFQKRTVFFLETSCKGALNSRQACAVESTAAANPNWLIVVVFTGPLKRSFFRGKSFRTLSSYPNIQFRRLNVTEFTKGSPVHRLFVLGNITNSMYPVVHSSDVLRILVLYRLGGIYLDLDIITMKSFDPLPKNFVAKQDNGAHANAIIAISKDEIGIKFAEMLLRDLAKNYNPNSWDGNGPHLIRRKLGAIKTCDSGHYSNKAAYICEGIQVFEPDSFYPIRWYALRKYYEDNPIMKTEAYTHHMFNSKGKNLKLSPNTLYARLAAKYCPNIYKVNGNKFGI